MINIRPRQNNRSRAVEDPTLRERIVAVVGVGSIAEFLMEHFHPSLAGGRWFTMSLAEQLGNVGSEYERALNWKQRGEQVVLRKHLIECSNYWI